MVASWGGQVESLISALIWHQCHPRKKPENCDKKRVKFPQPALIVPRTSITNNEGKPTSHCDFTEFLLQIQIFRQIIGSFLKFSLICVILTRKKRLEKNYCHNICLSKRIDTRRSKVQLFWEDHKNLNNLSHGFDVY